MGNHLIVVGGISATGKSTRVLQFIKFCKSKNWEIEDYYRFNTCLGILVKPLNLLIPGKIITPKNQEGQERWQGFDSKTKSFTGGVEEISDWLKIVILDHSVLIEGSSLLVSHRFRPLFFEKELGVKTYSLFIYLFKEEEKEKFFDRIKGRSGDKDFPRASWARNFSGFLPTVIKSDREVLEAGLEPDHFRKAIHMLSFDEPVTQLGKEILVRLDKEELVQPFLDFSAKIVLLLQLNG